MAYQTKRPGDPDALDNNEEDPNGQPAVEGTDPGAPFTPSGPNAAVEPPGSIGGMGATVDPVQPVDSGGGADAGDGIRNPPVLGLGPELGKPTDDPGVQTPGYVPTGPTNDLPGLGGAIQDRLRSILAGGPADVSAAVNAHRTGSQRAAERARALVAERDASQGLGSSGALDSDIMGIDQNRGESDANFEAGLTQDAQDKHDQMILQALGLGGNFLNAQQGLNLNASEFEANQNQNEIWQLLAQLAQQGQGA